MTDKHLAAVVGMLSIVIVIYRIISLMIPMLQKGWKERDWVIILQSFTLLV